MLKVFLYPSSPVNLLGPSPFRLIYCVILGCWGADVLQSVADQSLYYRSGYSLLDATDFFSKRSHVHVHVLAYSITPTLLPIVKPLYIVLSEAATSLLPYSGHL